ncbi:MAG: MFS transporter [Defluviitaleaceae bacterium]|nr:MFS transporter [Defluviitaleaceae bacterium]
MADKTIENKKKAIAIFMVIVALSGLALGLTDSVFSNYFRDAFDVYAFRRGLIEFPRELPGVITVLLVSVFAFMGNRRLALVAHALSIIGIFAMGLGSPSFNVMLIFLFINSLGMHMFMPLYDSMAMSLAKKDSVGTAMGRFNGLRTGFGMGAAILVFVGFRTEFFSFTTPVILNFVIAGVLFIVIFFLLIYLGRFMEDTRAEKSRFVFRKEYSKFYLLAILFGGRKQIMYVYGPWVLIELLGFGADNMALLMIAGAGIGIFFIPMVGRWIDKFGPAKIMIVEACLFLAVYLGYGVISAGVSGGWLVGATALIVLTVAIAIIDRMTMMLGMNRAVYMRSIAVTPEDVTPTLATGMALDHIVSIGSAILCGFIWQRLGPQYVFVFSGVLAVGNIFIARSIRKEGHQNEPTD